jgi:PBP1b-binding outer membrane lipoprotein LpoB
VSHMKIASFIGLVAFVLSGCSHSDPIDRLMTQVPFEDVPSYLIQPVAVPVTASPTEVIDALSKRGTLHYDQITRFKILEVRKVHSQQKGAESVYYSAVLMDSNLGRKIVLLQPDSHGWYYKIYDAK